jgi:hypothetical protein
MTEPLEQPPNPYGAEVLGERIAGSNWPSLSTCACGAVIAWVPGSSWHVESFPDDPRTHFPVGDRLIIHPPVDLASMDCS